MRFFLFCSGISGFYIIYLHHYFYRTTGKWINSACFNRLSFGVSVWFPTAPGKHFTGCGWKQSRDITGFGRTAAACTANGLTDGNGSLPVCRKPSAFSSTSSGRRQTRPGNPSGGIEPKKLDGNTPEICSWINFPTFIKRGAAYGPGADRQAHTENEGSPDAILLLDVFSKKTEQTPKKVSNACRKRIKLYDME